MEEILASIRKIISEDDAGDKPASAQEADAKGLKGPEGDSGQVGGSVSGAPEAPAEEDLHRRPTVRLAEQTEAGYQNGNVQPAASGFEGVPQPGQQAAAEPREGEPRQGAASGHLEAPAPENRHRADTEADQALDLTEMVAEDGRVVKIQPQGVQSAPREAAQPHGDETRQPAQRGDASFQQVAPPHQVAPPQQADAGQEETPLTLETPADEPAHQTQEAPAVPEAQVTPEAPVTAEAVEAEDTPPLHPDTQEPETADEAPSSFATAFGMAAQGGHESIETPSDENAETAEGDHPAVSYSDADLEGTPAFLTAPPPGQSADEQAPAEEVEPEIDFAAFDQPEEKAEPQPGDAFAELAGAGEAAADPEPEPEIEPEPEPEPVPVPEEATAEMSSAGLPDTDPEPHATHEERPAELLQAAAAKPEPEISESDMSSEMSNEHVSGGSATSLINGAGSGNAGLEAIVSKVAEPMIREWIEANMPRLVEDIVQKEVSRRLTGGS